MLILSSEDRTDSAHIESVVNSSCQQCESNSFSRIAKTWWQRTLNVVAPLHHYQCDNCGQTWLQIQSLLRPALVSLMLFAAILLVWPTTRINDGQPVTELRFLQSGVTGSAESTPANPATVYDVQNVVYLGEDSTDEEVPDIASTGIITALPQEPGSSDKAAPPVMHDVNASIMMVDSSRFTIQLSSSGSWREADQMMVLLSRRYGLQDNFYVYRSQANGKLLFPLLYGKFDSAEEAVQAINSLPEHLKSRKPFVRKFATVQRMLTQFSG